MIQGSPELISEEEFLKINTAINLGDDGVQDAKRAELIGLGGRDVNVMPGAIIRLRDKNKIGRNVTFGLYTYVNGDVEIGDNVLIGPHCCLPAGNHKYDAATGWFSARTEGDGDDSIVIGSGSWLASNVTVTAGVKLGKCNLVCAGSVVTKSTPDYAIMAGIPAKQIGRIDPNTGKYIWKSAENE